MVIPHPKKVTNSAYNLLKCSCLETAVVFWYTAKVFALCTSSHKMLRLKDQDLIKIICTVSFKVFLIELTRF